MNISLRQIRAFVAVAESGRFSLAAAHMHLTQSALSMMVKQLEGEMGARLFDRHTRMVQITGPRVPAGGPQDSRRPGNGGGGIT